MQGLLGNVKIMMGFRYLPSFSDPDIVKVVRNTTITITNSMVKRLLKTEQLN